MAKLFISRQEFAEELGINPKTFKKILNRYNIELPKGIITPCKAEEIRIKLGVVKNTADKTFSQKR